MQNAKCKMQIFTFFYRFCKKNIFNKYEIITMVHLKTYKQKPVYK